MILASIDIGSSSIQLLVLKEDGQTICDVSRDVGLGLGSNRSGMLPQERIALALKALGELVAIASKHAVQPWEITTVATSDLSRAFNAKSVVGKIQEEIGLSTHILTPEMEAKLAYQGGACGLELPDGPIAIVKIGSNTIEAVMRDAEGIHHSQTIRFGCVDLTEIHFGKHPEKYTMQQLSQFRMDTETKLAPFNWPERPKALIFVGGAAMAFATMELDVDTHNPHRVHGLKMTRAQLRRWGDRLMVTTPSGRRAMCPAHVGKADYMLAAARLMDLICEKSLKNSFYISGGGVRLGVLMDMASVSN